MMDFVYSIFKGFFIGVSAGLSGILPYAVIVAAAAVIAIVVHEIYYRKGSYYSITKLPFISVRSDLGRYGEYLIYKNLKSYEKKGARFLFNVYIPKGDGETTEIDVIMLCSKGLFVFESKNYSGWIFGGETQKNWYQTLPAGKGKSRKESFYNPIFQNNSHIKHLARLVGEKVPLYSVIAFSDRCTLKDIKFKNNSVPVVNRSMIGNEVAKIYGKCGDMVDESTLLEIYDMLYPFTQMSTEVKQNHIDNIRDKYIAQNVVENDDKETHEDSAASTPIPKEDAQPCERESADSDADLICPKCGGKLVLKASKKGAHAGESFYGCSNFPKCRYIKK